VSESKSATFRGTIGRTYRDSTPHWAESPKPAPGAPDVVFIVLDDVGFSDLGCYGAEIATPTMDALAAAGLRYNNFHVTAMCSPTRACLLTGRNAHAVGVGIIADFSNGYPGYDGRITHQAATLADVLRGQGYGTYALGKWHLTNMEEYGAAGPHDHWPLGHGFSRWYGFHGGLTDQWHPELCEDNHEIRLTSRAGYHLSEDLVDHAIANIRDHVTSAPTRPFMVYMAFGAAHFPHQAPPAYIQKYRGYYDVGWDAVRVGRLRKQKQLGIVPVNADLAPRNPGVQPWVELSDGQKRLAVRLQEAYAGFMEHTDAQIVRLVDYLKRVGRYDNTLIVLLSDNGASDEGGTNGVINSRKHTVYEPEDLAAGLAGIDRIGSEFASNHYPAGWAQVSNTPLKWYKKGNHGGGIRAPLVISWPAGIQARGELRTQYHHVVDIAPTIYEVLGMQAPSEHRGVPQLPIQGTSMVYTFASADAPTRKVTQYSELLGDRAIWHRGWKAVVRHAKGADFDQDRWELYRLDHDFAEARDLAAELPDKLKEMIELWWSEAEKNNVLPLDDRGWERVAQRLTMKAGKHCAFYPDMARLDRLLSPDISDKGYTIRADLEMTSAADEGVLLAWGSRFGGLVLYVQAGEVCLEYVYSEATTHRLASVERLAPGLHAIVVNFTRTGQRAGELELVIDNCCVAHTTVPKTWPIYGIVGGLTCGADDAGPPVSDRYVRPFRFSGVLQRVTVDVRGAERDTDAELRKALLQEQ
jgi:arylsulfatase A-like enzyme